MAASDQVTPSARLATRPPSLSERINIATRPLHTQLNRLILARLPLALPPHTPNPSTYASGLLHVAPIYSTFESLWTLFVNAPDSSASLKDTCIFENGVQAALGEPNQAPKSSSQTRSLLARLKLPGLARAGRLRDDIANLSGIRVEELEEQFLAVVKEGTLAGFIAHTTRSVEANPHVLVAYAWVLYMALFAGGRFLRATLKEAGGVDDFWHRDSSPVRPYSITQESSRASNHRDSSFEGARSRSRFRAGSVDANWVPGLSFFNFDGDQDGEDIKLEFKKRIMVAEVLLTEEEKEDIIQEAQEIFRFMIQLVDELDAVMGTSADEMRAASLRQRPNSKKDREDVKKSSDKPELGTRSTLLNSSGMSYIVSKILHFAINCKAAIASGNTESLNKDNRQGLVPAAVAPSALKNLIVKSFITFFPVFAFGILLIAWHYHGSEAADLRARLNLLA